MGEVTQIDPLYARRRGKAVQSEFDDSQVDYVPLNIPQRALMPPLKTADYQYRFLWGYDADDWEMIISDPSLAPLPQLYRQARSLERNLRALKLEEFTLIQGYVGHCPRRVFRP